jgi:Concanavalin A-like lectin/glucanases superfamily
VALMIVSLALILVGVGQAKAGFEATYTFNGNLNAQQGGAPSLTATDPLGTNGFVTDTVFGHQRTVYAFNGNATPVTDQAGLTFNNSGNLLTPNSYSVEMVFEFTQRNNAWRRILDVENRQSDSGFYVDPSNNLDVFPVAGSTGLFTENAYHDVALTVSGTTVKAYLDGQLQFAATTNVMDINNPNNPGNLVNFFLDNTVAGGQGEFSSGRVGLIRLDDGALSDAQVAANAANPFGSSSVAPEPASLTLLGFGAVTLLGYLGLRRWKLLAGVTA